MGFIYILTSPTGKSYIGQTIQTIHKRFQSHQYASSRCFAICNAIQKYGWENFEKDWYECPDEDLNFDEELLVEEIGTLAPNGYNLREGGGNTGKPSQETKKKISKSLTGKTLSDETKKKMSKARTGEKHPMYGKIHANKSKQKMSESKTGKKNHASKRVYQYTLDGKYINSFDSSGEAARALGKSDGSFISMCARGKRKSANGFKWSHEKLPTI